MAIDPNQSFGDRLKRHRLAAGLTQETLAERAGLSARGISDLERGRRASPYYDTIHRLADALRLTDDERLVLLTAARPVPVPTRGNRVARGAGAGFGEPALAPPSDLPVPLTALVGRENDRAALGRLVHQPGVRLVTLTGPGGVGKTRLALQVAADQRASFADGVVFVSLAALRDPELVLATIAHALGLAETSEPPLARLVSHLRGKRLLLVLDNLEHLLPAAPLVHQVLARSSDLIVLATSRVVLRLSGEHEHLVAPLALPHADEPAAIEQWSRAPAVRLFIERLRASAPRLTLTPDDATSIAAICARTEGLPLAIELAAARGRHLALPELAIRLEHRLQLLTGGARDLPARQRTLRDAIGWSYDLLSLDAQQRLRWLSVFAGGWTLDLAQEVMGDGSWVMGHRDPESRPSPVTGDSSPSVVDGLATLVESSLVRVERGAGGLTRYGMLETIREFASEQLAASGEADTVHHRHAEAMLAWSDRAERGLQSGERTAWSRAAAEEIDNVRAALRWSLDHGETEFALRIVGNLDWFWDAVTRDREGWTWCQQVLAMTDADRKSWSYARTLNTAGAIAWNMGEFARSDELLTESVARFRALNDERSLGQALFNLALTALYLGHVDRARRLVTEAITILEGVDEPWLFGLALFGLGEIVIASDPQRARSAYERSLAVLRAVGDPWGIAMALAGLGGFMMRRRDYATARGLMEEALALRRAVNNPHAIAISLTSLGELARREGDPARAMPLLTEGLVLFRAMGDAEHVAWTLFNLGMTAARSADWTAAAAAFDECLALRVEQGNPEQIAGTIAGLSAVVARTEPPVAARLAGAVAAARAANGIAMPPDEDREAEQRTLVNLRETLGDVALDAELTAGRRLLLATAADLAAAVLGRARTAGPSP